MLACLQKVNLILLLHAVSDAIRKNIFFCIVGPTGAGKSTFCRHLEQDFEDIELSVSATSRPPREGEVEGVDYFFITEDEFRQRIHRGEFFEWEETHGYLYGTFQSTVNQVLHGASDVLFDVDIRGALDYRKKYPDQTVNILVVPPSIDVITDRVLGRGDVLEEELTRRLHTARMEYRMVLDLARKGEGIDYIVVNDDFATAYWTVQGIVYAERARFNRYSFKYIQEISEES